jgi:hypothetical protein
MSYRAVPPSPRPASQSGTPPTPSAVPSSGSFPPVAHSAPPPGPAVGAPSRSESTLGLAGAASALLAIPALGLACLNLAQARGVGAFGLPEFGQRLMFEANMGRVLVFGGISLGLGVLALGLSGVARRATSGRVGLALGAIVLLGSAFAQASRARASFSPVSEPFEASLALGLDDGPGPQPPARDRLSPEALNDEFTRAVSAAIAAGKLAESAAPGSAQPATDVPASPTPSAPAGAPTKDVRGEPAGAPKASARGGAASVSGGLPAEVIQRVVRQGFGAYRGCYERGLKSDPNLAGRVSVSFTIGRNGSVSSVSAAGDLPSAVKSCVAGAFRGLSFPKPESAVKVTYPIVFAPGK